MSGIHVHDVYPLCLFCHCDRLIVQFVLCVWVYCVLFKKSSFVIIIESWLLNLKKKMSDKDKWDKKFKKKKIEKLETGNQKVKPVGTMNQMCAVISNKYY